MIRYAILLLLTGQVWALTTIARVGNDYITDYDVSQTEKVLSWMGQQQVPQDKLASYAKDMFIHASQVQQLAASSEVVLSNEEISQLLGAIAKHKGHTVDKLKDELSSIGIEWSNFTKFIQSDIIEKRLIFSVYRNKLMPSQLEIDEYIKQVKLSNPVDVSVLTAPLGTKLTGAMWQDKDSKVSKITNFNGHAIGHLPDAYQNRVLAMKTGDVSKPFKAFGQINQIRVNEYKLPEMDISAVQESLIHKKLTSIESEWLRYLAQNFPVKYI